MFLSLNRRKHAMCECLRKLDHCSRRFNYQFNSIQGHSLPLIYTEAGGLGGAAPHMLYTIFHQKYELVTQILVLNNKHR